MESIFGGYVFLNFYKLKSNFLTNTFFDYLRHHSGVFLKKTLLTTIFRKVAIIVEFWKKIIFWPFFFITIVGCFWKTHFWKQNLEKSKIMLKLKKKEHTFDIKFQKSRYYRVILKFMTQTPQLEIEFWNP